MTELLGHGGPELLAVTFVLVFAESAVLLDLVVPGEVGLVLVASAAREAGVPLWLVVAVASLGGVLGDIMGYYVGRRMGVGVVRRWAWARRRLKSRVVQATGYFAHGGGPAVAAARWIGALRAVLPVVAGSAQMPFGRFVAWDFPSTVLWVTAVSMLGFAFGDDVVSAIDSAGTAVSALLVVLVGAVGLWHRRLKGHRRPDALASEQGGATSC